MGRYTTVAAADSRTNRACVYIDSETQYAIKRYGYLPEQVAVVGNPDLLLFGMPARMVGLFLTRPASRNSDVMYIDSGLLDCGFVYHSAHEFARHIIETRNELQQQGKRLVYKPHPVHLGSSLLRGLCDAGVNVCSKDDFVSRLEGCCASIVERSSVALVPALMAMPVLFAQYGRLGDERFGELLTSYPRSRRLRDLLDFTAVLTSEAADLDGERTLRWIDQHSGPLPIEAMPERVAAVVASVIPKRRATVPVVP